MKTMITFYILLAVGPLAAAASPQIASAIDDKRLETTVQIKSGETTAAALARTISDQAGVTIVASAGLAQRGIVVAGARVSAKWLLDAICALEEWELYPVSRNSYELRRRAYEGLRTAQTLAAQIQARLPRNLRDFLILGANSTSSTPRYDFQRQEYRLGQARDQARNSMLESLKARLAATSSVLFDALLPHQKDDLMTVWLLQDFGLTGSLIYDDFGPQRMELNKCLVGLEDGVLLTVDMVANSRTGQGFGFGQNVVTSGLLPHRDGSQPGK